LKSYRINRSEKYTINTEKKDLKVLLPLEQVVDLEDFQEAHEHSTSLLQIPMIYFHISFSLWAAEWAAAVHLL
jgi:hypothetical protein